MKALIIGFLLLGLGLDQPAIAAEPVSNGKATELSLHRMERLVTLKKIDEAFQTKLKAVKLEVLPHQGVDQPAFKFTMVQVAGEDGSQRAVEITLTEEGRSLGFQPLPGGSEPKDAPDWSDKDSAELSESALHYVLDNVSVNSKLAPYFNNLSQVNLSPASGPSASGRVACVTIVARGDDPVLKIFLRADGTIESVEFVPK